MDNIYLLWAFIGGCVFISLVEIVMLNAILYFLDKYPELLDKLLDEKTNS